MFMWNLKKPKKNPKKMNSQRTENRLMVVRGRRVGAGKKVQTSSYKISKSCNVQHGDYGKYTVSLI